jgi:hypothetical protein
MGGQMQQHARTQAGHSSAGERGTRAPLSLCRVLQQPTFSCVCLGPCVAFPAAIAGCQRAFGGTRPQKARLARVCSNPPRSGADDLCVGGCSAVAILGGAQATRDEVEEATAELNAWLKPTKERDNALRKLASADHKEQKKKGGVKRERVLPPVRGTVAPADDDKEQSGSKPAGLKPGMFAGWSLRVCSVLSGAECKAIFCALLRGSDA